MCQVDESTAHVEEALSFAPSQSLHQVDEGLDAGHAVLRRGGNEREVTDHHPLHYIIEFAEWRRRSLAFEYLEEIAAIGLRSTRVPARNRLGDILADRATPGAIESS